MQSDAPRRKYSPAGAAHQSRSRRSVRARERGSRQIMTRYYAQDIRRTSAGVFSALIYRCLHYQECTYARPLCKRGPRSERDLTDGPASDSATIQCLHIRAAYTRGSIETHTYVGPDIDRQLATVTVYNSGRLVASASCRNTVLRAAILSSSTSRCPREAQVIRRRLES